MIQGEKKYLSIRETAEMLGVSLDTLRRWDENGYFPSVRNTPLGHRRYLKEAVEKHLNNIFMLATEWISTGNAIPALYYCETSALFQARLEKMQTLLTQSKDEKIKEILSLVGAVVGEIGNNSFDHNLGQWPDIPGIFFGYDLNKKEVILADRGQGVMATLKRVRPEIVDDKKALEVAFTEIVSGRAPEERGNGLKFVRNVVINNLIGLRFHSGSAELSLKRDDSSLNIKQASQYYRGCLVLISF